MTKSELISLLAAKQPQLDYRDVELAVKELLEQMSAALSSGDRIEVRGFGSFSLNKRFRVVRKMKRHVGHPCRFFMTKNKTN